MSADCTRRSWSTSGLALSVLVLLLTAAAVGARQGQTPVAQSAIATTGAVSGVVVDGATSRPIAGAVVYLTQSPRTPTGTAVRQISDARGRFVFAGLPPSGSLTLGASRPGYFDSQLRQFAQSGYSVQTLALAEGEWLRDVRLTLWKGGAIEGTIRDERGEPLAAIEVRSVAVVRVAGSDHLAAGPTGTTDDRGRYRISGLLPARYLVAVPSLQAAVTASRTDADLLGMTEPQFARLQETRERPAPVATIEHDAGLRVALGPYPTPPPSTGPQTFGYPLTFAPGNAMPSPANAIDVAFGDTRIVDISVAPATTGSLSGRIEGSAQIANRTVRLLSAGAESLGFGFETAATRTDGDGRFRLANVPVGEYVLDIPIRVNEYRLGGAALSNGGQPLRVLPGLGSFSPYADAIAGGPTGLGFFSGMGTRDAPRADPTAPSSAALFARMPVTVSAGGSAELVVPLRPSATIAGRVRFDSDTTGLAPFQMTLSVMVDPANGNSSQGRSGATIDGRTSTGGSHPFTITGVLPGRYFIRLGLGGLWTVRSISIQGRDSSDGAIDLTTLSRLDEVEITLTRSAGAITGTVITAAGAPASGARVCVFPVDSTRWTDFGVTPPWLAAATASQQGAYRIGPIPAGEYYVAVVPRADTETWRDRAFFARAAVTAPRVTVGWGESRTQPLRIDGR